MNVENKEHYICIPFLLYIFLFFLIPFIIIFFCSFKDLNGNFSLAAIIDFFSHMSKISVFLKSFFIALQTTIFCLLIGYPLAYFLAKKKVEGILVISLFAVPMSINFILKAATMRDLLLILGLSGADYPYLLTIIGMVYNFLPFAVFPLYNCFLKLDKFQLEATSDLGASPFFVFLYNIVPQSIPGIMSAVIMVFMPSASSYVIYDIFSEGKLNSIGNVIYFSFINGEWNIGCFLSCIVLCCTLVLSFVTNKLGNQKDK